MTILINIFMMLLRSITFLTDIVFFLIQVTVQRKITRNLELSVYALKCVYISKVTFIDAKY